MRGVWLALGLVLGVAWGCETNERGPSADGGGPVSPSSDAAPPMNAPFTHFMAVHCDPGPGATPQEQFTTLEAMVEYADVRSLKLTIMLTAQWAAYIAADDDRRRRVLGWGAAGHELAGHHHSVYHPGTWDGYSDFEEAERLEILGPRGARTPYVGTLADWTDVVQGLVPAVRAGCGNGERDKRVIPPALVYDTCPGFYTTDRQPLGTRLDGADPYAGQSDFVLVGTTDGIERRFLNHAIIGGPFMEDAMAAYDTVDSGAYGVVVHTKEADLASIQRWMDHVVEANKGTSATVSEIVMSGRLPERVLADDVFNRVYPE